MKNPWRWHRTERLHLRGWSAARVETPEASPSQRKPEQGQYPAGIHHTGICQTKTSFWKFGKQFGVTAFPAPHYGTLRRTKGEKPHAGCFCLLIFVVNANVKRQQLQIGSRSRGFSDSVAFSHLWIIQNSMKIKTSSGVAPGQNNQTWYWHQPEIQRFNITNNNKGIIMVLQKQIIKPQPQTSAENPSSSPGLETCCLIRLWWETTLSVASGSAHSSYQGNCLRV